MDSEFARGLDAFSDRVLAMTNKLLNLVSTVDRQGTAKLENQEDVVDDFRMLIVDPMDQLLGKNGASILSYCVEFLTRNIVGHLFALMNSLERTRRQPLLLIRRSL